MLIFGVENCCSDHACAVGQPPVLVVAVVQQCRFCPATILHVLAKGVRRDGQRVELRGVVVWKWKLARARPSAVGTCGERLISSPLSHIFSLYYLQIQQHRNTKAHSTTGLINHAGTR
jgi:hypothetical protein